MPAQIAPSRSSDAAVLGGASGISEVFRLATLLAERVLDAQITSRPVPHSHIRSLLEAALLLREYGAELPPLLGQIMQGVDKL